MSTRFRLLPVPVGLILAAVFLGGCGSGEGGSYGGSHPNYAKALAGSPPPLAALHKQANDLLSGGNEGYEKRLAELHGYPVVVNVWASWCGPCREEFPVLQKLSARYGKQVAFLGVNSEDSDDAAKTFLREAPLSYPSYTDPDKAIVAAIGPFLGFPETAFYDKSGRLVYLKHGPYPHTSELEADVRRYAVSG